MSWTALVPLKLGAERKSRLAPRLSREERAGLADAMATHVLTCLAAAPSVSRRIVLAPQPFGGVENRRDAGRGLNAELGAARAALPAPLLVIHGDLPFLEAADIEALIAAARAGGVAIAPDRHRRGTNAVAFLDDRLFQFAFGNDSREAHASGAVEIMRPGLAFDIDTPADLDACSEGWWRS